MSMNSSVAVKFGGSRGTQDLPGSLVPRCVETCANHKDSSSLLCCYHFPAGSCWPCHLYYFPLSMRQPSASYCTVAVWVAVGRWGHDFPPTLVLAVQRKLVMIHLYFPWPFFPAFHGLESRPGKVRPEFQETLFPPPLSFSMLRCTLSVN